MRSPIAFRAFAALGLTSIAFSGLRAPAAAATVYYSCGYTMEAADGSKTMSGCTTGAVEGPSPAGMLDRCLGKTKEKDGLVGGLDCCAAARKENKDLVAKHAKIQVSVTMVSDKQVDGPSGACK